MPSSCSALPTWVRRWGSTLPPTLGVSQKWLPRSLYRSTELLCYSVPARKTDLPGVAQYDLPGTQVGFADVGEISTRSGVLTRTAFEMDGIGDDGVQTRGYLCRRGGRNVEIEGISRFCDPMMLDMKNQRISGALGADNGGTHRTFQVSRRGTHGCGWINRAQVRHKHSAHRRATLVLTCRRRDENHHRRQN